MWTKGEETRRGGGYGRSTCIAEGIFGTWYGSLQSAMETGGGVACFKVYMTPLT